MREKAKRMDRKKQRGAGVKERWRGDLMYFPSINL